MSLKLPNGSIISIAATYDDPIVVSAISNATIAVASATAHGLITGDILEVTSGWSRLSGRVARVESGSNVDSFDLEGIDTSDTNIYPAGSGAGSVRKVLTWQQVSQILENSQSGGDQQFYNYNYLEDTGDERQMPTQRNAKTHTFSLADDLSLGQNAVLEKATEEKTPRIVRVVLPGGELIYRNAIVSFDPDPSMTRNQGMAVSLTLSSMARITRYAA